jgi:hypothetical protein
MIQSNYDHSKHSNCEKIKGKKTKASWNSNITKLM